jgi:nucleoside-diphosphate-sugar epimerase
VTDRAFVVGAAGYLAGNLLRALDGREIRLLSSRPVNAGKGYCFDLSDAPLPDDHPVLREEISEAFILARPPTRDYAPNRMFCDNLQRLLLQWCRSPRLRTVHFTSTALVYPGVPGATQSAAPHGSYEYFKLETELFLRYLHLDVRSDVAFRIYRLPIAFGGAADERSRASQFLYSFIRSYARGCKWRFESAADQRYGTSWFWVPDFAERVCRPAAGAGGYEICDVASGFFTYRELHELLERHFPGEGSDELHLFRTRFELRDQLGLQPRDLADSISTVVSRIQDLGEHRAQV